ncbi:MAG: hypothetical protein QOE84_3836 [Actinomycetota bacterium]|nr:hypothetical protein [Actinomycetota bacterium]
MVITGAGRGLGREYALAFANRGASVVVNDLGGPADGGGHGPPERVAAEVSDVIVRNGGQAVSDEGDVADPRAAKAVVDRALDVFGRVDVVVNNAGIDRVMRLADVTPEVLRRFFDVHVLGTYNVTAAAWPHLVEQGYGRVVTTTSAAGYFGLRHALPYVTAKGALHGMTQALALEGARHGINVNAVAPFAQSRLAASRAEGLPLLRDLIERRAPASAVAPVVLWLAHDSTSVTGAAFEVGGGTVNRVFIGQSHGVQGEVLTPELLRDQQHLVLATSPAEVPPIGGGERPAYRWISRQAEHPAATD